jgi:hypothetical protein
MFGAQALVAFARDHFLVFRSRILIRRFPSPFCARLNISHGNQSCGAINQKYHDQRNHDSRKHNPTDTEKAVVSPTARIIPLTAGRNVASVLMACHLTSTQDIERYNALRSGRFPFNPTNPRLSPFCCVTGVWAPWLRAPSWRPTTQSSNRSRHRAGNEIYDAETANIIRLHAEEI